MTSVKFEALTCGLSYQGSLPLAWREVTLPGEREWGELKSTNMDVLRTFFALESYSGEASEELPEADTQQVARLDFKLNLILDLVGYLIARQQLIPKAHPLILTPDKICWLDGTAPNQNSLLYIELYCSLHYPRPLALYARVTEVTPQSGDWSVTAEFQGLGETVRDALERFIFVQHRRAISHSRRSKSPSL
jgi:hypothetical protein